MGFRDHNVEQAARREDRAADITAAKEAWRATRETAIVADLETRPLLACMTAHWSRETAPPVSVELVEWVMHTSGDAARTLAEAIYSPTARHRLHRMFAADAASIECGALPESHWSDA
jgi:hypothetical protein